jgi:hypothetical protein
MKQSKVPETCLDIKQGDIKSNRFFKETFLLVYNIETNLNNGDKKIRTNDKNMTALEAISETIRDITFVNQNEDYNNHLDFIRDSLLHYTDNNKKDGILDEIRENFNNMKSNVIVLEGLHKRKEFTKDILKLFKEFYEKNANNQTIKNFITNNYYDLRGNKKTKDSKKFLDLGIDIGNLRKKINTKDVEPANYPFYLENLIEAMKYRYLIEKDKYDEYIYYMGKIAEIYQEIDTISPYKWEEKALITQLLKLYNIDIKSAIKYISQKVSKQKNESNDGKKVKRDDKLKKRIKELSYSVDKFEEKIEEGKGKILKDDELNSLNDYLRQVKEILTNYQDGNEVTDPLTGEYDILELRVGGPEAQQEGEEEGEEDDDDDDDDEEEGGLTRRQVRNRSRGGGFLPPRKRTPIKRR